MKIKFMNSYLAKLFLGLIFTQGFACSSIKKDFSDPGIPIGVRENPPKTIPAEQKGLLKRYAILGINDFHGYLDPTPLKSSEDQSQILRGGGAILSSYVNRVRELYPKRTILLDGGDMFQGTLISNHFKGASMVAFYNYLGVNAAAIGNHEFDFGPKGGRRTTAKKGEDPLGALKARIKEAKFPILAANIFDKASGKPVKWAKPVKIIEMDGVKIGIIGLSTPETPDVTRLENVQHLKFGSMKEASIKWSKWLRAQGAKLVLLTTHSGGRCNDSVRDGAGFDPNDLSKCDLSEEIFELAQQLPKGVLDGIVAGHTHSRVSHFVNGIPIIESTCYTHSLGQMDFFYDVKKGEFDLSKTKIHEPVRLCHEFYKSSGDCSTEFSNRKGSKRIARFLGSEMKTDVQVAKVLKPYQDKVKNHAKIFIANNKLDLPKPHSFEDYNKPWGALIADAFLNSVPGADAAFQNNGGIRSGLEKGQILMGKLFKGLPFENFLEVITVKGSDLKFLAKMALNGSQKGMQFAGLKIWASEELQKSQYEDFNKDGKVDYWEQTHLKRATLADGSPIDPEKSYRVVINDFMGGGGDNMKWVLKNRINKKREVLYGLTIRGSVIDLLEKLKTIDEDSVSKRLYME